MAPEVEAEPDVIVIFHFICEIFKNGIWGWGGQNIVFEDLNIQAGNDATGVPTDMLSLNSTVKILYRNPATFFGVHVTATPLQLHYYQLNIASGQVNFPLILHAYHSI